MADFQSLDFGKRLVCIYRIGTTCLYIQDWEFVGIIIGYAWSWII